MLFQFSVPNKGDCNLADLIESGDILLVSILSPQQRGLQFEEEDVVIDGMHVSILSPQQRGLQCCPR